MTAAGTSVLNRDLIEAIVKKQSALAAVRYHWIRGHAGHPANEACDALAKSAAMGAQPPTSEEIMAALRKIGAE